MELSVPKGYSPSSTSSKSDLLNDYHRLAADALLGSGCRTDNAILEAAEDGQLNRLKSLLANSPSSINARCPSSGDTPLIVAAREGHTDIVLFLLRNGADVTIQNDTDETAMEVASGRIKKLILANISHEDRAMSNAQALLHSAWLGDAVSVKKSLESGKNYLDVNCRNSDGNSPLLLVTRDISVFEEVQSAMQSEYDPVSVMKDLISNNADVNICDKKGRSALHMVANSKGFQARKMVSLLLSSGSAVDSQDLEDSYSPLHVASSKGHKAIIVALVEEGGADVNLRGGERGDTPLMLSARGGHNETAKYLISKGADVTAVDENGDTALNIAKTPSMVKLLKEAWVEQASSDHSRSPSPFKSSEAPGARLHPPKSVSPSIMVTQPSMTALSLDELPHVPDTPTDTPTTPQLSEEEKFFLTEGKICRSSHEGKVGAAGSSDSKIRKHSEEGVVQGSSEEQEEETDYHHLSPLRQGRPGDSHTPLSSANEAEADDELEAGQKSRRVKPATRRAYIRGILSKRNAEREAREGQASSRAQATGNKSDSLTRLLNSEEEVVTYSSADEGLHQHPVRAPKLARGRSRDDGKPVSSSRKKFAAGSRPSNLGLQRGSDPTLSHSYDSLATPNSPAPSPKGKKSSPLLPNVGRSPAVSPLSKTSHQYKPSSSGSSHGSSQLSAHLPSLTNMQAVAVIAVDTEKEKLSMLNLKGKQGGGVGGVARRRAVGGAQDVSSGHPIHRSNSVNVKGPQEFGFPAHFNQKKRYSTGSVAFSRGGGAAGGDSKVPLLPNVVTSQFGFGIQGGGVAKPEGGAWSGGNHGDRSSGPVRGRYSKNHAPNTPTAVPPNKVPPPKLGIVSEVAEVGGGHLSNPSQQSMGSKDSSTLKSSDFEADSLEQEVILFSTNSSATTPRHLPARGERPPHLNGSPAAQPPTDPQRDAGRLLPPPPQNPNLMVNYANPHSSTPLSPIWNQLGFLSDTDASTNSEYITSYVGKLTPLPTVLSPDFSNKPLPPPAVCEPMKQDHSGREPSSGESGEEGEGGKDGCLRWKRGRLLGKGAYGKVWEGLLSSARMIAVKEVELDTDSLDRAQSQYEKIQAEVGILRSLKHRNIVSYLGTSMHLATVYIFMQYISGGSLQSIIKRFGPLDSHTVRHYTRQITHALCYLHENGIIHRDIKGANIMVNSRGVVKLIDFGCAKNCEDMASNMHSVRGTPYWMAPEVICGYGYGRKSDIWSLGCTVLEMATTKPPWADYPPEAAMFQIGMGKPIPSLPDHLPKTLTDFFYLCLTREQTERPGASELLQHKFLEA